MARPVVHLLGAVAVLALAACGGGSSVTSLPPEGANIDTPRFTEVYQNSHDQRNRIRRTVATDARDGTILQQFERNIAPASYRNLIALNDAAYEDSMTLEVVAEVTGGAGQERVLRVLRLTADQAPFTPVAVNELADGEGLFFFRGGTEVYTTLPDGTFVRSVGELVNLKLDFRSETATIDLRTPSMAGQVEQIRTELQATVPFNIQTGTFGGAIDMNYYAPGTTKPVAVGGELRGNVHATAQMLRQDVEKMTTSGLYTAGGAGDPMTAEGIFWGKHPNTFAPD